MFRLTVTFFIFAALTSSSRGQEIAGIGYLGAGGGLQGGAAREQAWDSLDLIPPPVEPSGNSSRVTATVIRIRLGKETIELTASPTGQVSMAVAGGAKAKDRFRAKANSIEILDESGNSVLEVESHVGAAGGILTRAPMAGGVGQRQERAYLGVVLGRANEAVAAQLGVNMDEVGIVESVVEGSPAEAAGFQTFDIFTHLDGAKPATQQHLRERLAAKKPGETMVIDILRAGRPTQINTTLGSVVAPSNLASLVATRTSPTGAFNLLNQTLANQRLDRAALELSLARSNEKSLQALGYISKRNEEAEVAAKLDAERAKLDHRARAAQESAQGQEARLQEILTRLEKRLAELEMRLEEAGAAAKKK